MSDDMDGPGSNHLIAPPMEDLLDRAKQAALVHFVGHMEKDNVPATQRAVYILKIVDAQTVAGGGRVATLEAEAASKGVTVQALAQSILDVAEHTRSVEAQRQQVNAELTEAYEGNALDPTPLLEVLNKYNIELT